MPKNAAFEIAAEPAFDMSSAGNTLAAVTPECEPSGELHLHGAIEHGTFGQPRAMNGRARV